MTAEQKELLFANTARAIGEAPQEIQIRHIGNCLKADPAYGKGVADALGIPPSELPKEAWSHPRTRPRCHRRNSNPYETNESWENGI